MVAIAKKMFPGIRFAQGDAQNLACDDASFDRVLIDFGLLDLSHPERACAEAFRVLRSSGEFGFTVWAPPAQSPGAKIVNDAIEAHADLHAQLPEGPPRYLYEQKEECRAVMEKTGFNGDSMIYETRSVEWHLPTAHYFFEAERDAGVRTAGLLARQSPERLNAIRMAIENGIRRYAKRKRIRDTDGCAYCRRVELTQASSLSGRAGILPAVNARLGSLGDESGSKVTQSHRHSSNPRQRCNQNNDRRS